jgi:predicted membrane-bound spermidine synthase
MNQFTKRVLFFLFFVSGFSSLVYQVIWTRLAFASFGIITPVLSVVLSVFMLGLALGSWAGGRWIPALTKRTGLSAAFFYGGAELVIGLGAFAVPKLFALGENALLAAGQTNSLAYLTWSALALAAAIMPWCVCMGATFPFMMAYIREREAGQSKSFSFLYLANVLGAMSGTFMSAVIYIELLGFRHTLWVAAAGNFVIAFISFCLGVMQQQSGRRSDTATARATIARTAPAPTASGHAPDGSIKWILFSTGFIAMAMEVVWTRAFTPVLKTQVYSFAMIVFTYLGATALGSWLYRRDLQSNRQKSKALLLAGLAMAAFLPIVLNDARIMRPKFDTIINYGAALLLLAGIVPICALLGYLTPSLIDECAGGNPAQAGRAYALNVLGCILGPLFACYFLLPEISERSALLFLALPFLAFCFLFRAAYSRPAGWALLIMLGLVSGWSAWGTEDYESMLQRHFPKGVEVRRDYAATVVSLGEGWDRLLLVNGIGMTTLSPITKFMVHLPLAYHQGPPHSALVICFGMGTTYRSAVNWNIDTTVVELVPSVTKAFGFYHADAARFINATNGHIITDDGRRFLKRSRENFVVIVVDPPPPVEAAGSSLLYSREFCELAKQHLNPGGILQMWTPANPHSSCCEAALRSVCESFPYVRCFPSCLGWGMHILASMEPIPDIGPDVLAAHMPQSAQQDLWEWSAVHDASRCLNVVVAHEYAVADCLDPDPAVQITDDSPYNEYYLVRRWLGGQ